MYCNSVFSASRNTVKLLELHKGENTHITCWLHNFSVSHAITLQSNESADIEVQPQTLVVLQCYFTCEYGNGLITKMTKS